MPEPIFEPLSRDDWDENDWEQFLRCADVRTAKYQELFETLLDHPDRDHLIAHDMGWEKSLKAYGCGDRDCGVCAERFDCEAYEMLRLMSEPDDMANDPEAEDLLACFEQVREIPAYRTANEFATLVEDTLREKAPQWIVDDDVRQALFAAQMVPARVAGGHGIGYERDSLCGNIANCKRARRSLAECVEQIRQLESRGILNSSRAQRLIRRSGQVSTTLDRWIENLRARVWWR